MWRSGISRDVINILSSYLLTIWSVPGCLCLDYTSRMTKSWLVVALLRCLQHWGLSYLQRSARKRNLALYFCRLITWTPVGWGCDAVTELLGDPSLHYELKAWEMQSQLFIPLYASCGSSGWCLPLCMVYSRRCLFSSLNEKVWRNTRFHCEIPGYRVEGKRQVGHIKVLCESF